jgi:hypothetical protein
MSRKKMVEGKRYPLNMRTTKEMREKLERAAAQSGRSLVQEVEHRLERSFDREEISTKVSRHLNRFEKEFLARWIEQFGPRIEEWLSTPGRKENKS